MPKRETYIRAAGGKWTFQNFTAEEWAELFGFFCDPAYLDVAADLEALDQARILETIDHDRATERPKN